MIIAIKSFVVHWEFPKTMFL